MSAQSPPPPGAAEERPLRIDADPYAGENPYEVLGVSRDASRNDIKAAYRAIQKRAKRGDELRVRLRGRESAEEDPLAMIASTRKRPPSADTKACATP